MNDATFDASSDAFKLGFYMSAAHEATTQEVLRDFDVAQRVQYFQGRASNRAAVVQAHAREAHLEPCKPLKSKTFRWLDWVFLIVFACIIAAVTFLAAAIVGVARDHEAKLQILAQGMVKLFEDQGTITVPHVRPGRPAFLNPAIPQFNPEPEHSILSTPLNKLM